MNDRARSAKSGDEVAIRAYADSVFDLLGFDGAPAGMDEAVKDRLVRAEINHRLGHGKAITESRAVHAINRLAEKLGMPSYARTNVYEFRRARVGLTPYLPDMRSQTPAGEKSKSKGRGSSDAVMSPLEAAFFAGMLIQQKRYNAEYQLTNEEWIALRGGKREVRSNEKFLSEVNARRSDSKRGEEVERAIEQALTSMSPRQILSLPEETLDSLGVER